MKLEFASGTLTIQPGEPPDFLAGFFLFDPRAKLFRARGCDYGEIMTTARKNNFPIEDAACAFYPVELKFSKFFTPRPHQADAYNKWKSNGFRGIAALPTGSGKSFLAVMAIQRLQRPALIVVPTIDLLEQWCSLLHEFFGEEIGVLGGGEKKICRITVTTYDSAAIFMEFIGNRFALLIFDECHHLPGQVYRTAAEQSIAPYRLGLSATPEFEDDKREHLLTELIGEIVAEVTVPELEGGVLSNYEVERIMVEFSPEEREKYENSRAIYREFVKRNRINFGATDGWKNFLIAVGRSPEGRAAFSAYLRQRELVCRSESKLHAIWDILRLHRSERILVFTADNTTAYRIGREFYLPVITHHTKLPERRFMLESFRENRYQVLVTSKVLNEGVDVPEAAVGIVVSGSGSVREHVQRLGRILRSAPGKQAMLYELITADSAEEYTMRRRQNHSAYKDKVNR